ncbi:MAG: anti-sigma F factor [Clostridium argentinense]|uniref:Anti-sigma F factor n=1 Tax=Clostridium faecium TaxID=2762223 RepID=A0ABR8YX94_9CLOT|nr:MULTISPECIES: anti-sigma F factor [Clostridium]MBD8048566.1 anti-sigma F factor [Clostridium faecium]MBS5822618.1 anti-sigma F factor [Clostridium argentinense]MDU1347817.1 anti-sigma F factor [Clostridium argentinense]
MYHNKMKIEILSKSENESFARVVVSAFAAQLDPTIEEITDIKTAISEAVTNAIIHGYEEEEDKIVTLEASIDDNELTVMVSDEGKGIENLEMAREPLYTSRPDLERSGMGFTVMETFMDSLEVISEKDKGTKVIMKKTFNSLR